MHTKFPGRLGEIRLSSIARSPAAIAANWNAGLGRHFPLDANTRDLWRFDALSGALVLDLCSPAHDFTTSGLVLVPGPFCRLVYAASESILHGAGQVRTLTRSLWPNNYQSLLTFTDILWP